MLSVMLPSNQHGPERMQPLLGEAAGMTSLTDKVVLAHQLGHVIGMAVGENYALRTINSSLTTDVAEQTVRAENAELEAQAARWRADHDSLTGLLSKQAWADKVQAQIDLGEPFSLIYMDMDGFKGINDTYGHERGDEVLADFGAFMNTRLRRVNDAASYLTGRVGGDEFATIVNLTENDRRASQTEDRLQNAVDYLANSLQNFVNAQRGDIKQLRQKFDVSFGVIEYNPSQPEDAQKLISRADELMYKAKRIRKGEDPNVREDQT